jgi:8-oxo-dGTP diphosphatase
MTVKTIVASVTIFNEHDEVLMIKEENKGWNFPSGRIENGEGIIAAALREVQEETGLLIKITGTTGVYHFISESLDPILLFHFTGTVSGGSLNITEQGILETKWSKLSELLLMEESALRNASNLINITKRLLENHLYSVNLFHEDINFS